MMLRYVDNKNVSCQGSAQKKKNSSIAKGSEDQAEIDVLCCFKSLEERRIREARKLMQMKLAASLRSSGSLKNSMSESPFDS